MVQVVFNFGDMVMLKDQQESSVFSNRSDDTAYFISFTYIRKCKGPRIDLWSTPQEIFEMTRYLFSILTKNAWSVKYEWKQLTVSRRKLFAKVTVPTFRNLPGRLSKPTAIKMSIVFNSFRTIPPVVGFNWNLVGMSRSV